jgi:toxin ParE1/3/4
VVPELDDENIREWFADSYRVIYRIENRVVTIVAVVHGQRLLDVDGFSHAPKKRLTRTRR